MDVKPLYMNVPNSERISANKAACESYPEKIKGNYYILSLDSNIK